tara:strand:- start:59 stop:805 length:747 start_codon:yes stop_codon:yes gene_type:complete
LKNNLLTLFIQLLVLINFLLSINIDKKFTLIDSLYNQGNYHQSFIEIKRIYNQDKNNVNVVFRMARSIFLKAQHETDIKKQSKYYYKGFDYAKKAIKIDPYSSYANFWYAAYLGRIGELEGNKQAILNSYEVKEYALKAIELNPDYNLPYHMMGRWHYELANLSELEKIVASIVYTKLPEASYSSAVSFFKKAIQLQSNEIRHHFWLAKTYYSMNEYELANKEFKIVISIKAIDDEEKMMQSESKKYL